MNTCERARGAAPTASYPSIQRENIMRSTALCFAATIASCGAYVLPGAAPGMMRAQVQMSGVINDSIDKENPKVRRPCQTAFCSCCKALTVAPSLHRS